jgi:hypothetical protein
MTVSVTAEADGEGDSAGCPDESPNLPVPQQPAVSQVPINLPTPPQQQQQQQQQHQQQQPQQQQQQLAAPPTPPPLTDEELLAAFPVAKLSKLDEMISNPRQVSLL